MQRGTGDLYLMINRNLLGVFVTFIGSICGGLIAYDKKDKEEEQRIKEFKKSKECMFQQFFYNDKRDLVWICQLVKKVEECNKEICPLWNIWKRG